MPAGGDPSYWREVDRLDTMVGQVSDRVLEHRDAYVRHGMQSCSMPPPPATEKQNARILKDKYAGPEKKFGPYEIFKRVCFPEEV